MPRCGLKPTKTTSPPRPPGIIERVATARVSDQTASTLSRWTARQPLSEISSAGAVNWPPALLTSTSTRPKRSRARSTTRSTSAGSRTSAGAAGELPPPASPAAPGAPGGAPRPPPTTAPAPGPPHRRSGGAGGRPGRPRPPAADDDAGAGARELERGGPADARPAARDERDTPGVGVGAKGTAVVERPHCRQTYKRTNL